MNTRIERLDVKAYEIPTETPEADGTLAWNKTTLVLVEISSGGVHGIGYTFANAATAVLIRDTLAEHVMKKDAMNTSLIWTEMVKAIRNVGRPGIASMAISAVDVAVWDLKAKLLGTSVLNLLGASRSKVFAYGSGGFTSYSLDKLQHQLYGWVRNGIKAVKIKVGTHPSEDLDRVRAARMAIGTDVDLYVDANGAYDCKQALGFAEKFALFSVNWFEEPVSSDDLDALRLIRERSPVPIRITAGEYGYDLGYFRRMLESQAVDVLQADATRCGGVTGFLQAATLCQAFSIPLSAHTAPSLHAHLCCSAVPAVNVEYFFDHARIERMFFEGWVKPVNGYLAPDTDKPGFGIEFMETEAKPYAA